MVKKIFFVLVATFVILMTGTVSSAQSSVGDWKLHMAFDNYVDKVIDTKTRVYMQIPAQFFRTDASTGYEVPYPTLFVYDKVADELLSYNKRNYLNDNIISYISYNADKGYLLIVYENSNIDLLYDDDTVYNIPGLMSAVLTKSKEVNHVTFDSVNNRVYLATKFGYFVINDDKNEIAESHIYNIDVNSVGRVGDNLILFSEGIAYMSPVDDHHLSMNSFKKIDDISGVSMLLPLTDTTFAYKSSDPYLKHATIAEDGVISVKGLIYDNIKFAHKIADGGYFLVTNWYAHRLEEDGTTKMVTIPEENRTQCFSSYDFNEFWFGFPRKGLASKTINNDIWTVTRDYMFPNSPCVYKPFNFAFSDKYGMLICNEGINAVMTVNWLKYWILFNGYKDGVWSNYSPVYYNSPFTLAVFDPHGPSIDPDNEDICFFGTYRNGVFKMNLQDPTGGSMYSNPNDPSKNLAGFNSVFPASTWEYCNTTKPEFDSERTMWVAHDTQSVSGGANSLYYWRSEDRKNDNISAFKSIEVKGFESKHFNTMLPLKKTKNLILLANGTYAAPFWVFDHNGTLEDTSDDRVAKFTTIYDQDGTSVPKTYIYNFFEDQETGRVWVCTYDGIFTFNPSDAFDSDFRVHRIKVARNDGTNLADYLLDGIPVYRMTADGANRKWFATGGSGAVLTSADGSEVLKQLTTDNSYLPHNNVYGVGCDPNSNSVWISTHFGLSQYFSDATPAQENYDNVKAYPNPVRPDYLGWVTIEGLMDNSLVKIVDASGSLVKELGRSSGGMITWDVTNLEGKHVKTGVYYVLASQSEEGQNMANVSKILVVN